MSRSARCGWRWARDGGASGRKAAQRGVETLSATVRADPRLAEGLVVRFGGADWSVVGIEADPKAAGRVRLNLERVR